MAEKPADRFEVGAGHEKVYRECAAERVPASLVSYSGVSENDAEVAVEYGEVLSGTAEGVG